MTARKSTLFVVLLFLALGASVAQGQMRKVKVGIPAVGTSNLAFVTADEKGYYREEGLEIELTLLSPQMATQAVISKEMEFNSVPASALVAALRGAPLRIIFGSSYRVPIFVYGKPEIRDVQGLKGKKVGVWGIGSATEFWLRQVLTREGLEVGKDVTTVGMGFGPTLFTALKGGAVDAAMLDDPFIFMADDAGFRQLISFMKEDWLVHLQGAVVTSEGLLQSEPQMIEKFIRGTLKGHIYAKANRKAAIGILARYNKKGEELSTKGYDLVRPSMTENGTAGKELQEKNLVHTMKFLGLKQTPPPVENFFDFSVARKVEAELQAQGWKPGP